MREEFLVKVSCQLTSIDVKSVPGGFLVALPMGANRDLDIAFSTERRPGLQAVRATLQRVQTA